jgi:FkbM family methyltransferase
MSAGERLVSYAQFGEDVRLWRALGRIAAGRYVDVGAADPDELSVTRAFYDRGWSGINVEPDPRDAARLRERRPRDTTLEVALAASPGSRTLHAIAGDGLSTLDPALARWHESQGRAVRTRPIAVDTLERVWAAHAPGDVHFLKIDVEGAEPEVLAGIDLALRRPWVIVVEATRPTTTIPSHQAWEPRVLAAGYRLACDDGLNRYYVADEHAGLASALALPLEARDDHVTASDALACDPRRPDDARYGPAPAFVHGEGARPTIAAPATQLCTRAQFREAAYRDACLRLGELPHVHRQQWEIVLALVTLERRGVVGPGRHGVVVGAISGALPAVLAAAGCQVIVAAPRVDDVALANAAGRGLCSEQAFRERVAIRRGTAALAGIAPGTLDFACAFGLVDASGGLERGLELVRSSLAWLQPGAAAVHTNTFNLSSNLGTVAVPGTNALRRYDLDTIASFASRAGVPMATPTLFPGDDPVDACVDLPPYRSQPHLKFRVGRYVLTSIGLAFARPPG